MRYTFSEMFGAIEGITLDHQRLGEEIDQLRINGDGIVTWEDIVEFGREKRRSQCGKGLEWDNKVAAEHYRKEQARRLIRSLKIKKQGKEVRAFMHVPGQAGYYSFEEVMATEKMREEVIAKYAKRLTAIQEETKAMKEFAKVNREIEKFRTARRDKRAA